MAARCAASVDVTGISMNSPSVDRSSKIAGRRRE
jgi:hypothetical protein